MSLVAGHLEKELLVLCVRFYPNVSSKRIKKITGGRGFSWSSFIYFAGFHGVFPLVYESLICHKHLIPDSVAQSMREIYLYSVVCNLKKHRFIEEMACILSKGGVNVCFLKGTLLSFRIYGKSTQRSCDDIDIIVHEKDYKSLVEVIQERGYRPLKSSFLELRGFDAVKYAHYCEQIRFVKEKSPHIEIHFRFMNMGIPRLCEEYIWNSCGREDYGGLEFLVPRAEDTLALLIVHANQHRFSRFKFMSDIMGFYSAFCPKLSAERFQKTVAYFDAKMSVVQAERVLNYFYPNFHHFFLVNKARSISYIRRFMNRVIVGERKIQNLDNKPFFQRAESTIFYIFFTSDFKKKILYLLNVIFSWFLACWLYRKEKQC